MQSDIRSVAGNMCIASRIGIALCTTACLHAVEEIANVVSCRIAADFGDLSRAEILRRAAVYFGWCLFFFLAASVVGLLPSMFLFLASYIRFQGRESWKMTLAIAVPVWLFSYVLFHRVLIIPWPRTVIGDLYPVLRTFSDFNFF